MRYLTIAGIALSLMMLSTPVDSIGAAEVNTTTSQDQLIAQGYPYGYGYNRSGYNQYGSGRYYSYYNTPNYYNYRYPYRPYYRGYNYSPYYSPYYNSGVYGTPYINPYYNGYYQPYNYYYY